MTSRTSVRRGPSVFSRKDVGQRLGADRVLVVWVVRMSELVMWLAVRTPRLSPIPSRGSGWGRPEV
jgi:hypothetical protein